MNLAALLAWFNPTRWLILGGVALGLIAAQTGFYFWAHHRGYVERDNIVLTTKAWQGGQIGLEDRIARRERIRQQVGV